MEVINALGRRKTAVARVYLTKGKGVITVNNKAANEVFPTDVLQSKLVQPFALTDTVGKYNVNVNVNGGGTSGQAGAIRHGISRALLSADPEAYRLPLRQAGFLTRDPRAKERKKYGLRRARKAKQFTKR